MRSIKQQSGLSIFELLIGLALGTVALTGLASLTGFGIGMNANMVRSSTLNEETYSVVQLMHRDLRRAGFSGDTIAMVTDPEANPSPFADSIVTSAYPDEAPNSCILFTYDADGDGDLDNGTEEFGYRLRSGRLEMRQGGLDCTQEDWVAITDTDKSTIRQLTFTLDQDVTAGVPVTYATIAIVSESSANDAISRRYTKTFLVENHDG
ncbi:prepilin cleavage protein [Alteromonas sp. CYL-A6]|uniref:prepilin cleavage protein n=1 Tax=Alteromonas nitratireducens TaxID=3390813 RepID=UPI0034BB163C